MKEELLKKLETAKEILKDYNKFIHLFSGDDAVKTLAKLRETIMDIQFRLKLSELKEIAPPNNRAIRETSKPTLVAVRPCGEKYGNKTYLGFLIGDVALSSSVTITDDKIQCNWAHFNPAIYIPEFGEVVYGCESWWSEIKKEEDFRQITDENIQNTWYVKLWNKMNEKSDV